MDDNLIQREIETTLNIIPSQPTMNSVSLRTSLGSNMNYSLNTFLTEDVSINSNFLHQVLLNPGNQIAVGILSYAAEKLNVREGDPLFLLPRLNE